MLERAPCDPLDLLRAAASDAAPSASIEARMRQVLENLLRNAAQARRQNG